MAWTFTAGVLSTGTYGHGNGMSLDEVFHHAAGGINVYYNSLKNIFWTLYYHPQSGYSV